MPVTAVHDIAARWDVEFPGKKPLDPGVLKRAHQVLIKAQRIRTLQQVGENKVGEGIRPELVGIVNYAAMALVQLEKGVVLGGQIASYQTNITRRYTVLFCLNTGHPGGVGDGDQRVGRDRVVHERAR